MDAEIEIPEFVKQFLAAYESHPNGASAIFDPSLGWVFAVGGIRVNPESRTTQESTQTIGGNDTGGGFVRKMDGNVPLE